MSTETKALRTFILGGSALLAAAWFIPRDAARSALDELPAIPHPQPLIVSPANESAPASDGVLRLLQTPTMSKTQIAFAYAGEIWIVPRTGGDARRLVTGQLRNQAPIFSPDGSQIAFTGTFDENMDVYVVPASGGEPRRLTYHPGRDAAVAWTPDGASVLFRSERMQSRDLPQLFTVSARGGPATELPLPSGTVASYSPDATHLAYVPFGQWQPQWKRYRGGQTTPIWICDLSTSQVTKIPRDNSTDRDPMWVGDTVYFTSDRNGPRTLFAYDTKSGNVRELEHNPDGFDIKSASSGPDGIVYDQFDELRVFDLASGKSHPVPVTISADLPQVHPRFVHLEHDDFQNVALSPSGKRVLFEAHGEILSVPAEKGDIRNLTRSPGIADRDPAWSPDGKWIAWLSDASGEYALRFRSPDGIGAEKQITLGMPPSFFYSPVWSPDSKKIALRDARGTLWLVDTERAAKVGVNAGEKLDRGEYDGGIYDVSWSPDSAYVTYLKRQKNQLAAIFVYSVEDKSVHQITDGRSDAFSPRFDRSGKYLLFLASTDVGFGNGGMTMSRMGRARTSSVYAAVLRKDLPSPTSPESDEEEPGAGTNHAKGNTEPSEKGHDGPVASEPAAAGHARNRIDFDGLDQRIVAMPIDRAHYSRIEAGIGGAIFLVSRPIARADEDYLSGEAAPLSLSRYDSKKRKTEKLLEKMDAPTEGPSTFVLSADGSKILYEKDKSWFVAAADASFKEDARPLALGALDVWFDPRAEWRQIFHEVWRIQRDFFYDPNAHGLDLAAAEKLYAPFLEGIAGREDLTYLIEEGLGNLVVGHARASGGTAPKQEHVSVGVLGADYTVEGARYRFARILKGENWNPKLQAPLTGPGVNVKEGDFLLAVNGQELSGADTLERLFLGLAGKQTVLTVGPSTLRSASHDVTVVPVASERNLRLRTWMEENRKKVADLSSGRVGYVYVPDTGSGGFANFNRYYFAESSKDATIVDERFNHGGLMADYIVNILQMKPLGGFTYRPGEDEVMPPGASFGPKVMIANEMSGSGGDALPWMFKNAHAGILVGKRTWGGLVGICNGVPNLIDGGNVTAPNCGVYGTKGEWEVENRGISPDIEVEQDPALVRQGHDPQLERAVQVALEELAKNPPQKLKRPPFPDYGGRLPHPHGDRTR